MGVQRLPDPGMLPTSQEAGGVVHSNALAQTAPGTAPGFDGGTLTYNASTDSPQAPAGQDRDDRPLVAPSGADHNMDAPFPQGSQFGAESYNAGMWKRTPSTS